MIKNIIEPHIVGKVNIKSDIDIEKLGKLIGDKLFSGCIFGGKEENICEEIPAVYIYDGIMGLKIILQGYSGFDHKIGYWLNITPSFSIRNQLNSNLEKHIEVNLDYYLYFLTVDRLKEYPSIKIIEPII